MLLVLRMLRAYEAYVVCAKSAPEVANLPAKESTNASHHRATDKQAAAGSEVPCEVPIDIMHRTHYSTAASPCLPIYASKSSVYG